MKIAIDISQIVYGTGVSTYTKNLVENLLKHDKNNEYILFGGSLRRRQEIKDYFHTLKGRTFKGKVFPIPPSAANILWNKLHTFSIDNLVGKVDVFHSSDWSQPPTNAFKVTTVHDLVPILYPEQSDPSIVAVHKKRLEWVKKEIDRVIVPSKATKEELIELGFDEKGIRVISEAPDSMFKPSSDSNIDRVRKEYGIKGKYLVSVGVTPRKNTKRIINAFNMLRKDYDFELVVVGHRYSSVKNSDGVKFTGHIPSEHRPILFSGAEALIYPSLYEGFGLPILEAMACECPVVTSNTSSMPEVAGNAAILVDPINTVSIAEGIRNVIKERQKYITLGRQRVKMFSWQKTALETQKVYEEVNK